MSANHLAFVKTDGAKPDFLKGQERKLLFVLAGARTVDTYVLNHDDHVRLKGVVVETAERDCQR